MLDGRAFPVEMQGASQPWDCSADGLVPRCNMSVVDVNVDLVETQNFFIRGVR